MSDKKIMKPSIRERLQRLFGKAQEKAQPVISPLPAAPAQRTENMAFKPGAAVTFITPIGAYAGNSSEQNLRKRAEQQFFHMDHTQNTTIN